MSDYDKIIVEQERRTAITLILLTVVPQIITLAAVLLSYLL